MPNHGDRGWTRSKDFENIRKIVLYRRSRNLSGVLIVGRGRWPGVGDPRPARRSLGRLSTSQRRP
jgi:hypothetical protein